MWSCRFHITSKTAWHENVAVQVFKIQRMQVFRPEIELYFCCCYFKSFDRNLIFHEPIGVFLHLIVLKNFTGDARTTAETSAKARVLISPWKRPWHKKKKWSNHKRKPIRTFPFLALAFVLASTFSLENGTRSWRPKNVLELVFFSSTNQNTRPRFVRGFTKMTEAEGSLKKGFQKRCVSSLLPFSLD